MLEVMFKIGPTILLTGLNFRIMLVYRRSCKRRRRMRRYNNYDAKRFAEERRLMMLLGSTSLLFLVCVSPMVLLNITLSQYNLSLFYYQVCPCDSQSVLSIEIFLSASELFFILLYA